MASPWASARRSARSVRISFRRVCMSFDVVKPTQRHPGHQTARQALHVAVRVDLWVLRRIQRTSTWTRAMRAARCWCVRLLRVTSFTTICFVTHPARRSCICLRRLAGFLGPLGAMMGPSSEWKKVFGSPARRVGQSPQMSGSCYQVGRVRADLFF